MSKRLLILLICIILVGCSSQVPKFNQTASFSMLTKQCELGPRYPGSEGIELCRNLIINELKKYGAEIELQNFTSTINDKIYPGQNIIASFYPRMSRRILLAAHYDTRPWADKDPNEANHDKPIIGANDAASGVAVLLEIARILSSVQPEQFGIDLVFFDQEDMGNYGDDKTWCLGSTYYSENFNEEKPEKAIVVDMVGDKDLEINIEYISYHNSPNLVNEIWDTANELEFSEFKVKIVNKIYDDHVPLIKHGFNAIDIIDFDYSHWHALEDTEDKCSPRSLKIVGQTLLEVIYGE